MASEQMSYHLAHLTNDVDSPLFGDSSVHEGTEQDCNRCVRTWAGLLEKRVENGE